MRYELMLPRQIRAAIDGNWPVVLPLGVLEYHGEHLPVGLDTLVVVKLLNRGTGVARRHRRPLPPRQAGHDGPGDITPGRQISFS